MKTFSTVLVSGAILASVWMLAGCAMEQSKAPARQMLEAQFGATSNGLRMAISPVKPGALPSKSAEFYVTFQNVGTNDTVLNLGLMLANGKALWPTSVHLVLTETNGTRRVLDFSDKRYGGVAGRLDDYIVPLRAGSTYILHLSLEDYRSPATGDYEVILPQGHYLLSARFEGHGAKSVNLDMGGISSLPFWKGTLQSETLDFEVSGKIPSK